MSDDPRFEDFGRHGSSIRDELVLIFDDARFEEWVSGAAERRNIFADKIIGSISWSKEQAERMDASRAAFRLGRT